MAAHARWARTALWVPARRMGNGGLTRARDSGAAEQGMGVQSLVTGGHADDDHVPGFHGAPARRGSRCRCRRTRPSTCSRVRRTTKMAMWVPEMKGSYERLEGGV